MHRVPAIYAAAPALDEAELIARYGHLIEKTARRLAVKSGIQSLEDDLWSAGALGLLEAARRFEPGRGARFETFAEHRVRGAMLDEMRRLDHLPRRLRERSDQVAKARRDLATALGRPATDDEVVRKMRISHEELVDVEGAAQPFAPLDPEQTTPSDAEMADDLLERGRLGKRLAEQITKLPERLQTVLGLHYQEGCTYREIAQLLKVSEPRVCQLHAQALDLLREGIEREHGGR
jgi:RNA polymerase sigma factor for flagellar operon FliA